MLGLLAIAPLVGLAFLSYGRITEADRSSSELRQVQAATADLVDLVELQAALQDESFWTGSAFYIGEIDIPARTVEALLGVDPRVEAAASIERTDALTEEIGLPGLVEAIEAARSSSYDLRNLDLPIDPVIDDIVEPAVQREVDLVISLAAEQRNGSALVIFARKLEATNRLRSSFSDLRSAYFVNFGELDAESQIAALSQTARSLAVYEQSIDDVALLVPPDGTIFPGLQGLQTDPDRLRFIESVVELLANRGAIDFEFGVVSIEDLGPLARNFTIASAVSQQHFELVERAADVLVDEAEQQQSEADRTARMVLVVSLAVAFLSVASIVATTRWLVQPLAELGEAALALTLGGSGSLGEPGGPREIRLIHEALGEAIVNLERTEQQALALAEGHLDDPSLEQIVPGRFGATIHAAIEQLRASIGAQEEASCQLAYEAGHDGLTGLANRRASIEFLTEALRPTPDEQDKQTTVFFIDLDHFKDINDTHGHAAGDGVLRTVADTLRSSARREDLVGRIGGDEFILISREPVSGDDALRMGERYLRTITDALGRSHNQISASIGIAIGEAGSNVDDLLAEADVAMLDAKKGGRNSVRFFDAELRARKMDELSLSTNIRAGLSLGEFSLHYQPIVDSISGKVVEYEALIRWDRTGVGRVPPDQFIPFAEKSDLVIEIDRWVLEEAAARLASDDLGGVGIAVNISGRHLATGDLYGDLVAAIARTGIDPTLLTVEITESALVGDVGGAIETLRKVRDTGVRVAIDDFGTGFTSLTHLRSLPADVLKIDQSFTSNLDNSDDANLVRLVIQTAHILRLDVVVEGVETIEQAQRVTVLGADLMQGYYFAQPMPFEEIAGAAPMMFTTPRTSPRR